MRRPARPLRGAGTQAMNRTARLVIPILAGSLWGCDVFPPPAPPVQRRVPTDLQPVPPGENPAKPVAKGNPNPRKNGSPRYRLVVRIKVVTIEAPVGTVSNSERVWSWLDEELVGPETLVNLGRNGFRIGVGRRDDWPAVAKILQSVLHAKGLTETLLIAKPRDPVSFVLKQRQGVQTIFTFHPDRTCSGADYPPGDNLLTLACTFDAEDPTKLRAIGVPQIRTTRHRARIVKRAAGMTVVEQPTTYSFDPLVFQLRFAGGDFVMIGPGVQAARAVTVGHHFLIKKKGQAQAKLFETVLVLIPEVVAAPVSERGPAPLSSLRSPARRGG